MKGIDFGDSRSGRGLVRCSRSMGSDDVNISPRASIKKLAIISFGSLNNFTALRYIHNAGIRSA